MVLPSERQFEKQTIPPAPPIIEPGYKKQQTLQFDIWRWRVKMVVRIYILK